MTGGVYCEVVWSGGRLRGMTLKFEEQDLWLVSISEDESWCVQSTWMPTGGCRDVDSQLGCRLWVFWCTYVGHAGQRLGEFCVGCRLCWVTATTT